MKSPERARAVAVESSPIDVIALLEWADVEHPRCVRLRGMAAVAALVPLLVRFVVDEPDLQRRELDRLSDLVSRVPIVRLERPRAMAGLGASVDAILAVLEEGRS
jgi:hypothetical protein